MIDLIFITHSPKDVPPSLWQYASNIFVGATDQLFSKSQVQTFSSEKIIEVQREVNGYFLKAKVRNDQSHYGVFRRVVVG